jgi:hypothetical protein
MSLLQTTKARAAGILLIASTGFVVGAAQPAFASTGPGTTPTLNSPADQQTVGGTVS